MRRNGEEHSNGFRVIQVPTEVCTRLLDPYFEILSRNASTQIYERVKENIFDKALESEYLVCRRSMWVETWTWKSCLTSMSMQ